MPDRPLETFLSYSHDNEVHRRRLRDYLRELEDDRLIQVWDDHDLGAGTEFNPEIEKRLEEAKVFIFLVSPEFIDSNYCDRIEMKRALERYRDGNVLVLPVILRKCDWRSTRLAALEVVPKKGRPIVTWTPQEAGWEDAKKRIRAAIEARYPQRSMRRRVLAAAAMGLIALGAWALASWAPSRVLLRRDAGAEQADSGAPPTGDGFHPPPLTPVVELLVESRPRGMIALSAGGKVRERHESPLRARVTPGEYELEVSGTQIVRDENGHPCSGGVAFHKREMLNVKTTADRPSLQHTIQLEEGTVVIKSVPASHVSIDGVLCGDVPLQLTVLEGTYTASFECDPEAGSVCRDRPKGTKRIEVMPGASNPPAIYLWP